MFNNKSYITKSAFTLIEIMVAVTIFSVIMVSVISVFIFSGDLNNKIDINRKMQENIKNITETIAEDIRLNGIDICNKSDNTTDCHDFANKVYDNTKILYVGTNTKYTIGKKVEDTWTYGLDSLRCSDIKDQCTFLKIEGTEISELSNSWVTFKSLDFYVSSANEPKATINFVVSPAIRKGVKTSLIKNNKITFQTTLSERLYDYER